MNSSRQYIYKGSIKISSEDMALLRAGQKRCTIRMGSASVASDTISMSDGRTSVPVRIVRVDNTRCFKDLTDQDALDEGLHSRDELELDLRKYYPRARGADPITVIYFESLDPQQEPL
jgi:hypothetical protein